MKSVWNFLECTHQEMLDLVSRYVCTYVSMCVCMYVCMCVCMYVCMYVYQLVYIPPTYRHGNTFSISLAIFCISVCQKGFFGYKCKRKCDCNRAPFRPDTCTHINGTCMCREGRSGRFCNESKLNSTIKIYHKLPVSDTFRVLGLCFQQITQNVVQITYSTVFNLIQ